MQVDDAQLAATPVTQALSAQSGTTDQTTVSTQASAASIEPLLLDKALSHTNAQWYDAFDFTGAPPSKLVTKPMLVLTWSDSPAPCPSKFTVPLGAMVMTAELSQTDSEGTLVAPTPGLFVVGQYRADPQATTFEANKKVMRVYLSYWDTAMTWCKAHTWCIESCYRIPDTATLQLDTIGSGGDSGSVQGRWQEMNFKKPGHFSITGTAAGWRTCQDMISVQRDVRWLKADFATTSWCPKIRT